MLYKQKGSCTTHQLFELGDWDGLNTVKCRIRCEQPEDLLTLTKWGKICIYKCFKLISTNNTALNSINLFLQ